MAQGTKESVALAGHESDAQDLPSLVEQLAENVTKLLDQKITLLRVELKEEIAAYLRGAIVITAGAIVAAVGFALANIALAFVVSTLFSGLDWSQPAKYALGFFITGLGFITSIGNDAATVTRNLRELRHGFELYPPFQKPDIPVKIEVDYKRLVAGKDPDIQLRAGDVVVVKESFF